MRDDFLHLDLTFRAIPVGDKETAPNLKRLLYKGGASVRVDQVDQVIQEGLLGYVQIDRVELVRLIHEGINGSLAGGGSPATARVQIANIAHFFSWSDISGAALNMAELVTTYLNWTEHLLQRVRVVKDLKQATAYNAARLVGQILDGVLGRAMPIIRTTRLRRPTARKISVTTEAEKQNLRTTFEFGRLLQDICDGIPLNVVPGPRLVREPRQSGEKYEYKPNRRDSSPEDKQWDGLLLTCRRLSA